MAFREIYRRQVALLLRVLPLVGQEECFALKGGTAINLFVRDMPRLSVDIDLTFLPISSRQESLAAINAARERVAASIGSAIRGSQITRTSLQPEGTIVKLIVRSDGVQTKIEVTPVLRGCVYPPELRRVSPAVEDAFGFDEMTAMPVTVRELETARENMIAALVAGMPADHRRFLISFERGEPDWQQLGFTDAQHLPAVQNLNALTAQSHAQLVERLEAVLVPRSRSSDGA